MSQKSPQSPLALEYIRALRNDRTLTSTEKLAAVFMASHAGRDGINAHPGMELLAAEIGLKERQTKTVVGNLTKHGWLVQVSSGRGNNRYASVYGIAIPQGATDCTLDASQGAIDCTPKVQSTASQGATHCPTNQPVESPKEIPVSQVSDVTDVGEDLSQTQGLTDGQERILVASQVLDRASSADGAVDGEWPEETPQTILDALDDIFSRYVETWRDKPRFDPAFLGVRREQLLSALASEMNRHRFDMYQVIFGMFQDAREAGFGVADHNLDRIDSPAKFLARMLSGDLGKVAAYGKRGKGIDAWTRHAAAAREAAQAQAGATLERAERELWESTEAERAKIVATMPEFVPARVRPLAGARFQTWLDARSENFVPVWHHPEFGVVFAGGYGKCPGPDWMSGYINRHGWDRIKDQDVIPLSQAA